MSTALYQFSLGGRNQNLIWTKGCYSFDLNWNMRDDIVILRSIVHMYVCCVFVSLSHFWLIHFFHLHLLYQTYLGICQATCVQSQQRQPISAVAIATCEVQVSAADSRTVPTEFRSRCAAENLSLYTTLYFTGPYTSMQLKLLTHWLQLL